MRGGSTRTEPGKPCSVVGTSGASPSVCRVDETSEPCKDQFQSIPIIGLLLPRTFSDLTAARLSCFAMNLRLKICSISLSPPIVRQVEERTDKKVGRRAQVLGG